MDTSEGTDNDSKTTKEAGLESGVLTGGTFAVVVVTDDDPLDALVAVFSSDLGNSAVFAGVLVLDLVGLTILGVDGTNEAVLCRGNVLATEYTNRNRRQRRTRDVLEMSTVLEPWATSGDVISC